MSMSIKINGINIKQPKTPNMSTFNLTKSGRTASGRMTMDLIAKKRKLLLTYEVLSGDALKTILAQIDNGTMFFEVSFIDNGVPGSFTAYVGEIARELYRSGELSGWYWKNVTFNFIEQ